MFQCHVRGRFIEANDSSIESNSSESKENVFPRVSLSNTSNLESIKELSEDQIEQMKTQLSKELTPVQIEQFGRILNKFKKGTTTKDHVEGMVSECEMNKKEI